LADGWAPFPTPPGLAGAVKTADLTTIDQLAERIRRFRELREEAGREGPFDVCCGAFSAVSGTQPSSAQLVDEYGAMAHAGVTWTTIDPGGDSVAERMERLERFRTEVVEPLGRRT